MGRARLLARNIQATHVICPKSQVYFECDSVETVQINKEIKNTHLTLVVAGVVAIDK